MATALGVLGAVAGPIIGGIFSGRAADKAREGQQEALGVTTAATAQARGDINRLFGQGRIAQRQGFGQALDLLGQTPEQVRDPFQQGNVLAQEQVGRGLGQVRNAILGSPIDLSGFQARSVQTPPPLQLPQSQQPPAQIPPNIPGAGLRPPPNPGTAQLIDRFQGGFRLPPPRPF